MLTSLIMIPSLVALSSQRANASASVSALAATVPICLDGAIRSERRGKVHQTAASYCTSPDFTRLYSQNCVKESCRALQHDLSKLPNLMTFVNGLGTPGFKLCKHLGGAPEIIEFQASDSWHRLDRCVFTEDGSFVDAGSLFGFVRDSLR